MIGCASRPPRSACLLPLVALVPLLTAFDYGTPIHVRTEEDLYQLELDGEIDVDQRDTLLQLLDEPLDLAVASWDELQLLPGVTAEFADAVIAARERSPLLRASDVEPVVGTRVWRQCGLFVRGGGGGGPGGVGGHVALRALEQLQDSRFPVVYLKGRTWVGDWLDVGVLVAEQEDLVGVEYGGSTVIADDFRPRVALERAHALVERRSWAVIAGHYQAGFGQGLVFDVTDRVRPHGFRPDLRLNEDYEDRDSYSVSRRLLGLAGRAVIDLHNGDQLDLVLFGSVAPHDLYFGDLDPNDLKVTSGEEVTHPTFPAVYREDLLGLGAAWRWTSRSHVGVTGWFGRAVKAYEFDFTGTPIPNRPLYGAIGADVAVQVRQSDLFAEVAVTDSGGVGTRAEWLVTPPGAEISMAARYYGAGFDNPHSRGRSQPDEFGRTEDEGEVLPGGKRDRDEVGPQLRLVAAPLAWLHLVGKGDLWAAPSTGIVNLYAEGRADLDPLPWLGADLFVSTRDKDLTEGGREFTYSDGDEDTEKGHRVALGAGLRLSPLESFTLQTFVKDAYEDSDDHDDAYLHTVYTWTRLRWAPFEWLALTARLKVLQEDLADPDSGEHYLDLYGQVALRLPGRVLLLARYDVRRDLGEPAEPETIHKLKACAEVRF